MNEIGFTPKNLVFDEEGRKKLVNGINTISSAVKSTLGPSGQTVLIESPNHTHGITVTKDGVTVAKSIDLLDPVENLAVRMMKEASERTATSSGDGTTTAIVLTEALVNGGLELIDGDKTEVLRDLHKEAEGVVLNLKKRSKRLTKKMMRDVATISANNDPFIGGIISKVYNEVGKHGIVTVGESQTSSTYYETTHGLKIDRGFSSNLFINDQKKDECIFENTHILVSDSEISNVLQIEKVLKYIIQNNKSLLIIAPCSSNVLSTLAANKLKRDVKVCAITPPSFGYKQHELMQDIAVSVGATYYSEKTGDDLSHMTEADLGFASKTIVDKDSTVVVKDSDSLSDEVKERISQLRVAYDNSNKKHDKDFIMSRIASLTGGVGVIFVGGNTDLERKELHDRVDDAVCAVRSALEEGVLPGGGTALYKESKSLLEKGTVASTILGRALMAPKLQIMANAGLDKIDVYTGDSYQDGLNVKTGEEGDLYTMGVIDPLKVTRSALENAVSVAITILSTNAIITMARTYEAK